MTSELTIIWGHIVINVAYKGKAMTYMFKFKDDYVDMELVLAKQRELEQSLLEKVAA